MYDAFDYMTESEQAAHTRGFFLVLFAIFIILILGTVLPIVLSERHHNAHYALKREKHPIGTRILWTRRNDDANIEEGTWVSEITDYSSDGKFVKIDHEWFESWKIKVLEKK